MLRPWKFIVIEGEGRNKLAQLFVDAMKPEDEARKQKLLTTPMRAPMIIIGVATIKEGKKPIEQVCSMAAAIQNLSLACHALGYGSIWLTGGPAYDAGVKAGLGLKASDEIVGYLYVGTPTLVDRPVPQHNLSDFVQRWPA